MGCKGLEVVPWSVFFLGTPEMVVFLLVSLQNHQRIGTLKTTRTHAHMGDLGAVSQWNRASACKAGEGPNPIGPIPAISSDGVAP